MNYRPDFLPIPLSAVNRLVDGGEPGENTIGRNRHTMLVAETDGSARLTQRFSNDSIYVI